MSNELSRFNRVRYTLYGKPFTSQVIKEPNGWQEDEKELLRSEKFHGVMTSLSNNLKFYGDAYTAIKSAYDIFGIKADIRLEKEERNPNTDDWELSYEGNLDFSTYQQDKKFITIKFNESQFFKNIESRFKDKFELDRLDDLKGGVLPPLEYSNLEFKGRDIFRETLFDNEGKIVKALVIGNEATGSDFSIPLYLKYKSDASFFAPTPNIDSTGNLDVATAQIVRGFGDNAFYNPGTLFYLRSEKPRTIDISIKLRFKAKFNKDGPSVASFKVFFDKVDGNDGADYETFVENQLISVSSSFTGASGIAENQLKEFYIEYSDTITLVENDCMGLRMRAGFSAPPDKDNRWYFEFEEVEILVTENDLSDTTNCEVITYYQAFDRLFRIITGKQTFQSDLLSTTWRDLLLTNGFKLRQFPDKQLTISLEELYESLSMFDDIALIIENQTVRVELKNQVYQRLVGTSLTQVSNVKRKIVEKLHFSRIEIGYDFDGEYEEVVGLDEYNIKNEYSTCIDTVENVFKQISKVRADGYGMTFAQEKQYTDTPKEDTKYDKENFAIDAKLDTPGEYLLRYWEDDFDNEPTGVFSPQTAFNLRLSPFNCLLRKGKFISTGLQKFRTELLKYSSTEGNSQLVTLYPERAVIANSVLAVPYFLPEEISFDKKITMLQFKEIINSKYKLIKFVNEFGNEEYGFIYPSIKPNKEGKFVLIKANL